MTCASLQDHHRLSPRSPLIGGLAACSPPPRPQTDPSRPAGGSTADPEPIASIPALDGVDTQVTLDQGFVDAITSLGLTPGVIGTATLDGRRARLPDHRRQRGLLRPERGLPSVRPGLDRATTAPASR